MNELNPGHLLQKGKYQIISKLGQGGFGITYLAKNVLLKKKVTVKEFFIKQYCDREDQTGYVTLGTRSNAEMISRYLRKFISEASRVSNFDHPNIVRVTDVFEENNTAYYVMDYIDGPSLDKVVKRNGALKESVALKYIKEVADGLSYVHSKNINHFDIKPGNIMIKESNDVAILIDFGSSKQYDDDGEPTSSTPVGVSPGYAPSELSKHGGLSSFSPQTDIYELGATLYTLVTGKVPPSASEIIDEGLPELPESISKTTRYAIEKSMEIRRVDRPSSVEEFVDMLTDTVLDIEDEDIDDEDTELVDTELVESSIEKGPIALTLLSYSGSKIKMMSLLTRISGIDEDAAFSKLNSLPCTVIEGISTKEAMRIGSMLEDSGAKVEVYNKEEEDAKKKAEEERLRKEREAELKRQQEEERKRLEEEKRKKAEEERLRKEREAELNRQQELERKRLEEEKKKKAEEERLRREREAELKRQQELERKRLEEEKKKKAEEERLRKEREAELKRQQEEEKKRFETDKKRRLSKVIYGSIAFVVIAIGILLPLMNNNDHISSPSEMEAVPMSEIVDLGLSVKWSSCNLGASVPEEYGYYYAWGETSPKEFYSEETYTYKDDPEVLPLSADVAHLCLDGNWRIPTDAEFTELQEKCEWIWTELNGVKGYNVEGPNGKSIFLPAAGYRYGSGLSYAGSDGHYWSSSLNLSDVSYAFSVDFDLCDVLRGYGYRSNGFSVRPVLD